MLIYQWNTQMTKLNTPPHAIDLSLWHKDTNTQLFTSQDVNWWTRVVWIIVMFLSAVWTLNLTAPIHCRESIGEKVMQCYISPNLMKKQTHLRLCKLSFLGEPFLGVNLSKCMLGRITFYTKYIQILIRSCCPDSVGYFRSLSSDNGIRLPL